MPDSERIYKVALFGVTGCGKSSIVNLLADKEVASVSTGVEPCTKRAQWYPITVGEMKFRLWDTMGFNQAEARDVDPLSPYEQAHTLLRNLQEGVDLVLLCARKDGVNASLRSLYWLLDDFFFAHQARIALVLTHFDSPNDEWWNENRSNIGQRCNIQTESLPHACITTAKNPSQQSDPIYHRSKRELQELLRNHATTMENPTPLRLDLSAQIAAAAAVQRLCSNCRLFVPDATRLVEKFKLPKRPFHAILFGEAGAGKSSIINLLVGRAVAPVSSDLDSCTLESRSYKINTGMHQFLIWDTVGLNGTQIGHDVCGKAIENAVSLVRSLHEQGGVDLLVFCKKQGRLSPSELNSFRLFQEFLCERQIPVAFVITHLEHHDPMEKWWIANGDILVKACDLRKNEVAGHACITSLSPENLRDQKFQDKSASSRQSILAMLEDSISYGNALDRDEGNWVMSFLRKLVGMVRVGNVSKREKLTVKNLTDRCGLNKEQADELIRLLYSQRN